MIPKTFEEAFAEVEKLVANFETNPEYYLSGDYLESDVRKDFIDRFFLALGYDMYHVEQTNPYEREVRIEKSVRVEGRGKRADYAFYISPDFQQTKFICEAKKAAHKLENKDYCFQTLRYGWNSNTPLAILTDFQEFFILDSRYKPSIETALDRIHKRFIFTDYADKEKFREIYYLFSREAAAGGSIEKYAANLPKARGAKKAKLFRTQQVEPVDEEFLSELDEYREELARAFKRKNAELDGEALTEITQRTLDRLVFIRFLEDKLVEPSEIIDKLGTKTGSAWRDFIAESERLNKIYNGIIFKPHRILDNPEFAPDAKSFETVRDWLSGFNSPYDFNTIPIHILGSIYERFLGKTIEATDKRAKVVEKPEVRKAGGVYYTPEYIVRYIVENTIGKMIEGKKPEEIKEMRFADIACGSGSFLLGVFDYLIAYHVRYFDENKTRREKALKENKARETAEGSLQLTLSFKRDILLNNIYGVDLDAQAVEVAQLSLYLKLLEEETTTTAQQHLAGFREQLLPSLGENIVHGNSLIDFDIMDGMLFDTKDLKKLNPMNFEETFPEVFRKGGFDAIVGNPPYIRIQTMKEFSPISVEQLKKSYNSAKKGNYDIYVVFIEKALQLLNENGKLGYIVPHKFFNAKYGEEIRRIVAKGKNLEHIVHFGDQQVFEGATTYTSLFFLSKIETHEFEFIKVDDLIVWRENNEAIKGVISSEIVSADEWNFVVGKGSDLFEKLSKMPNKLGELTHIFVGLQTNADDVFILEEIRKDGDKILCHSKSLNEDVWLESNHLKYFLKGSLNIRRYEFSNLSKRLIFPYETFDDKSQLISEKKYQKEFPLTWNYLKKNKSRLTTKIKEDPEWYGYVYKKNHTRFDGVKLLVPAIANQNSFTIDNEGKFYFVGSGGGGGGGYGIKINSDMSNYFFLGLLNSKLLEFFLKKVSTSFQGGYFALNRQYVEQLPIRTIDFDNPQDKERHDKLVGLVEQMLDAKKKLNDSNTDKDKQFYERFCASLDSQIDRLVYDLYELNDEEIAIVQGK